MFSWLRKQQEREQRRALYQNNAASAYLSAYFGQQGKAELAEKVNVSVGVNSSLAVKASGGARLSLDERRLLISINSELRRLYQHTAGRHVSSFDAQFVPRLGWEKYLEFED